MRGTRKFVLLSAVLASPFVVLAVIFVWIFTTLGGDGPIMRAAPKGAGAGDTGGANALGEILAGRDADRVQAENRAVREGTLARVWELRSGFVIEFRAVGGSDGAPWRREPLRLTLDRDAGGQPLESTTPVERIADGLWRTEFGPGGFPPSARIRIESATGEPLAWGLESDDGRFRPVPAVEPPASPQERSVVRLSEIRPAGGPPPQPRP
ncbi:MAG: hypothetical protein AAFR38_10920 [Planctomycetota bacterium]